MDTRTIPVKLATWLLVVAAAPLHAQEDLVKLINPEAQQGDLLCWAAASMTALLAVERKDGKVPGLIAPSQWQLSVFNGAWNSGAFETQFPTRLTTGQVHTEQNDELDKRKAYSLQLLPKKTWEESVDAPLSFFTNTECPASSWQYCNRRGYPILLDQEVDITPEGAPLGFPDLQQQMKAGRPVVFGWDSLEAKVIPRTNGKMSGPEGNHYLVATGTRIKNGTEEVRIWDPWPKVGADKNMSHGKWISYTVFATPDIDHGADARHEFDRYNIRRPGIAPIPLITPAPPITGKGTGAPCENPANSLSALPIRQSEPFENVMRRFTPGNIGRTLRGDLPVLEAGQNFGTPFPIVPLSSLQIVKSKGEPAKLIDGRSSAAMVTIEDRSGNVVGSFSALRDSPAWRRTGYVNDIIAGMMVETRREHFAAAKELKPPTIEGYYMVSIPSRRAFFVAFAHPQTHETMLVPIATDERIRAHAGQARSARDLLGDIATEINSERKRTSGENPGAPRPWPGW